MSIAKRKSDHLRIALNRNVRFRAKTSGFEAYDFVHCALPEMDADEVSTQTVFMGKTLSVPLMVSPMTGGFVGALAVNRTLAEICETERIALAVGSQRQIMENSDHLETFRIVRKKAPNAVIIGNIGASQAVGVDDLSPFQRMVDLIEADAMAVHLNPLQELLQPEGHARFRGVLKSIERLVKGLGVPVVVKETGCGISESVARMLASVGVEWIDVAGSGGTSWAGIESYRGRKNPLAEQFWDWGIPTADALEAVRCVPGIRLIASGGIDCGITAAKAVALGADLCGAALPFLRKLAAEQKRGVTVMLREWREQLKTVLFLTGSKTVADLKRPGVLKKLRP
ncbi:MAG TPA: type 2 isopentenyl-diphosphate Delta-isomerase [bacterium]